MSQFTERLLQVGAICAIVYFGWSVSAQTVVSIIQLQGQLQTCQQSKQK